MILTKSEPIELLKYPYPYQAAFTVSSDIDSGSILRFQSIHALFCGNDVIKENTPEWHTLGLTSQCPRFDKSSRGVPGLGLPFADSFFLIGDSTTFGMYRYLPEKKSFQEDEEQGNNCAAFIRRWIKEGQIDSFHSFLHYRRRQLEPLLNEFYRWCEREEVAKPRVWVNHSRGVTPTGLCPDSLQPNRVWRLARFTARMIVGPLFGRKRLPILNALVRYQGDTPGSPYYVNDLLAANGLRYVHLNMADFYRDQIALPEHQQNGRATILQPITMDDGVRYWRFERCYGRLAKRTQDGIYLRDSEEGCDASHLINEKNLGELCEANGTCILQTHWTSFHSMPIADETISRFELLRRWRDEGRVWITSLSKLLEWTRRRTFLRVNCFREPHRWVIELNGVDDPIFGREPLSPSDLHRLSFRLPAAVPDLVVSIDGQKLGSEQIKRVGNLYWLNTQCVATKEAQEQSESLFSRGA